MPANRVVHESYVNGSIPTCLFMLIQRQSNHVVVDRYLKYTCYEASEAASAMSMLFVYQGHDALRNDLPCWASAPVVPRTFRPSVPTIPGSFTICSPVQPTYEKEML